ncbi:hypothetical protein [Mycolicibacterium sp. CH28]|nr:hypothetical protein [Mycolicibacterium sp. CH28]
MSADASGLLHENGYPLGLEEDGVPGGRTAPPIVSAVKDQVRAEH